MFSFFKSKKSKDLEFMQEMFESASFRDSLDKILSTYSVDILESKEDKLENEVIGVSIFIAEEAIKRNGLVLTELNDDELFYCMLIGFVSSDHVSRLAQVSFELTSATVCMMLASHREPEEIGVIINVVINAHTRMGGNPNEIKLLQAIGNQVSLFFSTCNDEYLNQLAKLFASMEENTRQSV